MKYYLVKIFLIAITSMSAFGANKKKSEVFKYVLIDLDIVDSHKITRIKLNASIPYKKDIDIEMINFMDDKDNLILFTLFPTKDKSLWR